MANTDEMKDGFQKDFAKMMAIQMKYFMPVLILLSTTFLPAGLTLYFVVANVFGIFQTLLIRKLVHKTN
jgi:membrane protein insertase Oxa1/YidC/SpoIIIJ